MSLSRHTRNAEDTDQNVLTIFLPLLAVALTLCAGACCYMEKKRKQKIKKGAGFGQNDDQQHMSDIESIISTSSRNRSYLLPNSTTGRSFRSVSRTGSTRSGYGGNSTYGEPPPYSGKASRRSSIASMRALEEDKFGKGAVNKGFSSSKQSLGRSRSLLDLSSEFDQAPLRRTRSSANMRSYSFQDNGYVSDRRSNFDDDDMFSMRSGRSGYAQSMQQQQKQQQKQQLFQQKQQLQERPRRQSRSQAMPSDAEFMYDRPSMVSNPPGRGARSSIRRSASQPNLRNNINKTRTYPQGILKRKDAPSEDGSKYGASSVTGVPPSGGRPASRLRGGARSLTRLQAYGTGGGAGVGGAGAAGAGGYNRYPNPSGHNNFTNMQQQGMFDASSYNGSNSAAFPPFQPQQGTPDGWNSQYGPGYNPYTYSDNYWEQGSVAPNQDTYDYGSMIY